ncbi:MAG TPA: methyltransferase [Polyangiaceae bacterium]|nr:methyltransferase [Polyangiaceae bacterium]
MHYDPSSRSRLSPQDLPRFAGSTLFDRIARTLCRADCLPRKELFEAWEVARRVRRRLRGGRVVDLACGHGLLGHLMLLLDDSSSAVLCADTRLPASAHKVATALVAEWPRLGGRVRLQEGDARDVELSPGDVVVSAHACGALTDVILERAAAAAAGVAVLPCCHAHARSDTGSLEGWLDAALAIDVTRAARLAGRGYRVHTQQIPAAITPKRRLLLGAPATPDAPPIPAGPRSTPSREG